MNAIRRFIILFSAVFLLLSCGSDDSNEEVTNVHFLADTILLSESVRINTNFVSDDLFDDASATTLIFEISPSLSVEENSFRIAEGEDDTDSIDVNDVLHCDDGRTLVQVFLSRDDLRGNRDDGEFELRFNVTGRTSTSLATVGAAAGDNRTISCNEDFLPQAADGVRIVG